METELDFLINIHADGAGEEYFQVQLTSGSCTGMCFCLMLAALEKITSFGKALKMLELY